MISLNEYTCDICNLRLHVDSPRGSFAMRNPSAHLLSRED